ncbi:MAG: MarC family protein [Terrimicrobiaceae bacterium]
MCTIASPPVTTFSSGIAKSTSRFSPRAIFPLAIPLLTGPGTITSTLLLTAQARGSFAKLAVIVCALALVFLLTRVVIGFGAERLMSLLRPGGLHVVTRVLGILLAALAVQFVLNGIGEFVRLLEAGLG